jgi:hypothetical protein
MCRVLKTKSFKIGNPQEENTIFKLKTQADLLEIYISLLNYTVFGT